jgi:hypothetical protein
MIRYRYVTDLQPPAPFVNVTIQCPTTGASTKGLPAQIDPAADRTVIPGTVVSALGLVQVGRFLFEGFGGAIVELPVFLVAIQVHDLPPLEVRAVIGEKEPYVLLGRDVLNNYRVLLDGPEQVLEIELTRKLSPSTS